MKDQTTTMKIIRLLARTGSLLCLGFLLFMLGGHLFGSGESMEMRNPGELLAFLLFPLSTILGLTIAWKWEGIGGMITITSIAGLFILRPDLLSSLLIFLLALPGILFLIYWLNYRIRRKRLSRSF